MHTLQHSLLHCGGGDIFCQIPSLGQAAKEEWLKPSAVGVLCHRSSLQKVYTGEPGKLVRHMQNLLYTYDAYLICIGLGQSISSVICKNLSYSRPSYPSSPVVASLLLIFYQCFSFSFLQMVITKLLSYENLFH